MRKFYQFYAGNSSIQQLVGLKENPITEISVQQVAAPRPVNTVQQAVGLRMDLFSVPWGHHVMIINKIKQVEEALFYIQQTIEHNWSRAILTLQIEQNLFARQGKAITNFKTTLPEQQAQMAKQILKDPYNFGFLTLVEAAILFLNHSMVCATSALEALVVTEVA